jgi:hypothetical protein
MLGLWALFWIGGLKRRNKMGVENDEMAIVNSQLSVRGVEKLSVIDASVMSSIQSANINAAMIMLTEKVSDILLGKAPLVPQTLDIFDRWNVDGYLSISILVDNQVHTQYFE